MFIVDLNADIRGGFTNLTADYKKNTTGNRCRNIKTMQNVTNRNLIDPNKSGI